MTAARKPAQTFTCWLCFDTGERQSYDAPIGTGGLCDCAAGRALAAAEAASC